MRRQDAPRTPVADAADQDDAADLADADAAKQIPFLRLNS